jgi:hypothetical protein
MTLINLARTRAATALRPSLRHSVRNYSGPTVGYDHFTSGWDTDNIKDTEPGKYVVQTFNAISPKVSSYHILLFFASGVIERTALTCLTIVARFCVFSHCEILTCIFIMSRVWPSFLRNCMMSFPRRKPMVAPPMP